MNARNRITRTKTLDPPTKEDSAMDSQRLDDPAKSPTVTPSRRRLIGAMAAGAGAMFVDGPVARRAAAQDATPTTEEGAEPSHEALVFARVEELPPSPALVGIVRVTYPPGAVLPLEEGDPSLAVV